MVLSVALTPGAIRTTARNRVGSQLIQAAVEIAAASAIGGAPDVIYTLR
jgi:hypothetical protein